MKQNFIHVIPSTCICAQNAPNVEFSSEPIPRNINPSISKNGAPSLTYWSYQQDIASGIYQRYRPLIHYNFHAFSLRYLEETTHACSGGPCFLGQRVAICPLLLQLKHFAPTLLVGQLYLI